MCPHKGVCGIRRWRKATAGWVAESGKKAKAVKQKRASPWQALKWEEQLYVFQRAPEEHWAWWAQMLNFLNLKHSASEGEYIFINFSDSTLKYWTFFCLVLSAAVAVKWETMVQLLLRLQMSIKVESELWFYSKKRCNILLFGLGWCLQYFYIN